MRLVIPLVLGLALASPASAYFAPNGLTVREEGAERFVVPYTGSSRPTAFWCAAGSYARHVLALPTKQLIYRASEPPRRSGEGMRFSTDPADSASSTGLLVLGAERGGLSIGMAQALCEDRLEWRR